MELRLWLLLAAIVILGITITIAGILPSKMFDDKKFTIIILAIMAICIIAAAVLAAPIFSGALLKIANGD